MSFHPWRAALYLLTNLVLGVVWFVVVVVMIALTVALSLTILGVVVGPATVSLWRTAARFERWRAGALLNVEILPPLVIAQDPLPDSQPRTRFLGLPRLVRNDSVTARPELPHESIPRRLRVFVTDGAAWRELAYLLLLFPICIVEFVLCVVLLALTVALLPFAILLSPIWLIIKLRDQSPPPDDGESPSRTHRTVAFFTSFVTLDAIVAITNLHANFAQSFLGRDPNAELKTRVETLTRTRSASVDAGLAERRRIERDLHDGAQQRLVKLAMDLGMAQMQMESNPERAQELIASAHEESKLALSELRNLVRGIHPAILTDRGLDAAISAVADRSQAEVDVDVQVPDRLPETIESAAYYVVVEALTNIDKHGQASKVTISIRLANETLRINVLDDGAGGARIEPGGGLAGLRDRLAALDGSLEVSSPAGGPTLLHAEIPCALSSLKTPSSSAKGSPAS